MEEYSDFAYVYDELMDNIPYREWSELIDGFIVKYGISEKMSDKKDISDDDEDSLKDLALASEKNLVLDLGCGTGTLTEMMYKKGYDMIGVDFSTQMLEVAMNKKLSSGAEILYLNQDMRELDMYSTIGTVYSVCDSINYLLTDEDVLKTFSLVHKFLYPDGIFIFDFNTVHKYETAYGDSTIAEDREDCAFIWENFYDEATHINEYELSIFVKVSEPDRFRRFTENHFQRGYTLKEMEGFLKKCDFEILKEMDADSKDTPDDNSERVFIVARKK